MEADVTRNIEEQLSAFLDGELPEAELQLLIRRLEKDEAYRATLARYSLVGSILRDETEFSFTNDIRTGVMARIAAGEFDSGSSETSTAKTLAQQPAASLARRRVGSLVAATVAALAVVGVYQIGGPEVGLTEDQGVASVADAGATGAPEAVVQVTVADVSVVEPLRSPPVRAGVNPNRMTSYMLSHGEFSRSLQGTMVDSRVFVQQASYRE